MNCKNCGAELHEGAVFCGNCGMRTEAEQQVYEAPVQGEYHQENYNEYQEQGSYVPPVMPEYQAEPVVDGERPNTVLWIVLAAVEIFTCCQLTGIISLIFAILGHVAADKGDFAEAEGKIKTAKIWFWVGLGLGLLFVVAYIVLFALGIAAGLAEEILYY
ncbi:MAG: zinc-ribbon domain-containing protein [Ruminococcaceae bacterium]|nr:zinc-ribbon domain-containing protein [Oscillospiraceae bacterium]